MDGFFTPSSRISESRRLAQIAAAAAEGDGQISTRRGTVRKAVASDQDDYLPEEDGGDDEEAFLSSESSESRGVPVGELLDDDEHVS